MNLELTNIETKRIKALHLAEQVNVKDKLDQQKKLHKSKGETLKETVRLKINAILDALAGDDIFDTELADKQPDSDKAKKLMILLNKMMCINAVVAKARIIQILGHYDKDRLHEEGGFKSYDDLVNTIKVNLEDIKDEYKDDVGFWKRGVKSKITPILEQLNNTNRYIKQVIEPGLKQTITNKAGTTITVTTTNDILTNSGSLMALHYKCAGSNQNVSSLLSKK